MTTTMVLASADHAAPKYRFMNKAFTVRRDGAAGLYVCAVDYGCSRTYATPSAAHAVKLFLAEHGHRLVMVHSETVVVA